MKVVKMVVAKKNSAKSVKKGPKPNPNCGSCNHPSSFHKDRTGICRTMACSCPGFTEPKSVASAS